MCGAFTDRKLINRKEQEIQKQLLSICPPMETGLNVSKRGPFHVPP